MDKYNLQNAQRNYSSYTEKELIKDLPELLKFIDAHNLTPDEANDNEYLGNLIDNFYENK